MCVGVAISTDEDGINQEATHALHNFRDCSLKEENLFLRDKDNSIFIYIINAATMRNKLADPATT